MNMVSVWCYEGGKNIKAKRRTDGVRTLLDFKRRTDLFFFRNIRECVRMFQNILKCTTRMFENVIEYSFQNDLKYLKSLYTRGGFVSVH